MSDDKLSSQYQIATLVCRPMSLGLFKMLHTNYLFKNHIFSICVDGI